MAKRHHHRAATLGRLTVETWLRRQGLISVRRIPTPQSVNQFSQKVVSGLNWTHIYDRLAFPLA